MNKSNKFSPEVREHAVRMVQEHRGEYPSLWLHNESAISSDTLYHVIEAVDVAASSNGLYKMYLQEELLALRTRFDLRYWPSLAGTVDVMANDAEAAQARASDPLTHAATASPRRATKAEFFMALFEAIKGRRGQIRAGYRPTDATLAALATCALDLPPTSHLMPTTSKMFASACEERRANLPTPW